MNLLCWLRGHRLTTLDFGWSELGPAYRLVQLTCGRCAEALSPHYLLPVIPPDCCVAAWARGERGCANGYHSGTARSAA
jgi:hypothetical protein